MGKVWILGIDPMGIFQICKKKKKKLPITVRINSLKKEKLFIGGLISSFL